jgi:hypothetical protein
MKIQLRVYKSGCLFNAACKHLVCLWFAITFLLFYTTALAQTPNTHTGQEKYSDTTEDTRVGSFPAGSLVLMADGTEEKIENVKVGEMVAAYDPVLEDYILTEVTDFKTYTSKLQPITTVMLILEELSASLQMNGGLAGVSLQATAASRVYTKEGPKKIEQLTENDLLYCYDDIAHRFLVFRVYELRTNSQEKTNTYYLQTAEKNCIINSTVVLQTQEF